MHLFAGAATTALVTLISLGAEAADLSPPALFGQPQYGMAPPPPVASPQVIIVPGAGAPQYPSAAFPPPPVGPPQPYGIAPPIYPRADIPPPVGPPPPYGIVPPISPRADVLPSPRADVLPRPACPPTWRCGEYGCGWQPSCAAPPERYSGQYASPGEMYPQPGPHGPLGPPMHAEPNLAPAPYSDANAPRGYPGPTGPY